MGFGRQLSASELPLMATSLPPRIADLLDAAADKYSVPRPLARAIAWVESRGNTFAKSHAGALGVMQLMPATAAQLGVKDPHDPAQNIDAGVRYYAQLASRYGERAALAAYNWGPGNVARAARAASPNYGEDHWPGETRNYVASVLQRAEYELATLTPQDGARVAAAPLSASPQPLSSLLPSSRKDPDDHHG
jgi:soluble lytic murein transglycosylase-like protein